MANNGLNGKYTEHDFARRFKQGSSQQERSPFETDKGRIIHSSAFRRLQGKTQVLGVGERDFYRTRLTHSLEVAQIGRGMCAELPCGFQPDADLVEAICLAHDIGHPAFGHFGEKILHKAMHNHGGFGANPQNIRIVTFLEAKYENGGLDLTRATLDGLVKYPVLHNKETNNKSKCTYSEDSELLDWIKDGVKDPKRNPIEGAIADWADQIAYAVNDIEDAFRAGLLSLDEMEIRADEIELAAKGEVKQDGDENETSADVIRKLAQKLKHDLVEEKSLRLRKVNLKKWTSETIKTLMHAVVIQETHSDEISYRYKYSLIASKQAKSKIAVLKKTSQILVFDDPRVKTLEYKGGKILESLYDALVSDTKLLPLDFQEMVKNNPSITPRAVSDFVAGMTDRYAYSYFNRLFQPGSGSFYEDV